MEKPFPEATRSRSSCRDNFSSLMNKRSNITCSTGELCLCNL